VERLLSLDSVNLWEKDALAETWREPGHEADTVRFAAITLDRRAI
jgi:glutathione S-transferase